MELWWKINDFLWAIYDKLLLGKCLKFVFVGTVGAGIHFGLLYVLTDVAHFWYILSAALSIITASTWNYILNHKVTFSDRTVKNHFFGWFKYQLMSGITDSIYLGLLALFTEVFGIWYIGSALIAVSIVFPVKFAVANKLIWNSKKEKNIAKELIKAV